MVDKGEIEEAIRRILLERLRIPQSVVNDLSPTTPLLGRGLGLDSIEATTLIASLEQVFSVEFSDEELEPGLFASLQSLIEAVAEKPAGKSQ
ncbi:MAG TPA: acyl carrier protein [Acidobacteriota bacterium]|nr:acyl carrier protein [Acidobacteriota bacterium]HRV09390.1 acyl carrier protein [Acidobacteriota bacterium]